MSETSPIDRLRNTLFPPGSPGVKNFKLDIGDGSPAAEVVAQSVLDALEEVAHDHDCADLDAGAVAAVRELAKEGLGFNCTFVDDDMRLIVGLAQRAVLAGLASDLSDDMQRRFAEAAEKHRAAHERSLGREIKP